MFRLCVSLSLLVLTLPLAAHADPIYKWIDRDGNVHFSDKPDPEFDSRTVTVAPGPTEQQIEEARRTGQKIQQSGAALSEQNAKREAQREAEAARRRQQQAEAEARQRKLEETYQQEDTGSGWYYGGVGIHPRPPRPRPPVHRPRPPSTQPVPTPLPTR